MIQPQSLEASVTNLLGECRVIATDLTGGGDHWHLVVISDSFAGQLPLARQRPLLTLFGPDIQSGAIHALDLKCITNEELETRHNGVVPRPFAPHGPAE